MDSEAAWVSPVTLESIRAAQRSIGKEIIRTPLVLSGAASDRAGVAVYLKLENLQRTGAFKVRGALNKLASFTPEQRARGIICASSGNHGLGVAYAAARYGVRAVVVLPENANPLKVSLIEKLGAQTVMFGTVSDARQEKVRELTEQYGYAQVHPFSDPVLISGQGTIGLEIVEDLPEVDEVYVPIGGGGLISGIATAVKELRPQTRVYGVEPEYSNAMKEAVKHGRPFPLSRVQTIADGLAARITEELNLAIVRRYVDDIIEVSDRMILEATEYLLEQCKVFVEPSGATSLAGLFLNPKKRGKAVAVLSGGNATLQQLEQHRRNLEG